MIKATVFERLGYVGALGEYRLTDEERRVNGLPMQPCDVANAPMRPK